MLRKADWRNIQPKLEAHRPSERHVSWRATNAERHSVCCDLPEFDVPIPFDRVADKNGWIPVKPNVSLLKSCLQKNIRRCEADAAVKVAFLLMKLDHLEFTRRLCVIVVEDGISRHF